MPSNAAAPSVSTLDALVAAVRSWDGSASAARRLREEVRSLPDPRRKPELPAERAIFVARAGYARRSGVGSPEKLALDPELARCVGPFLGDPELGRWPFHDPLRISDEEAIAWLPLLGRFAAPDDSIRDFIEVMFQVRRRTAWVAASYAFAALAVRDETMRGRLERAFASSFPAGVPSKWPGGRLTTGGSLEDPVHQARHVLHAACAFLAEGGPAGSVGGLSAGALAATPLPAGDQSDASTVLLGLRALLAGAATREAVLPHLAARAAEAAADELQEAALREIADALAAFPAGASARARVVERLAEPRWREVFGIKRADALWSWLETARWARERGEEAAIASMAERSFEAGPALRLRLGGALPDGHADAVEAALPRLRTLLDPDVRATTDWTRLAVQLSELLVLLEGPPLATVPWRSLVRRALGPAAPAPLLEGTAGEAARAELTVALAGSDGSVAAILMRDAAFDASIVLRIASCQDGFVARQVAVQMERLLREATPGEAQLRLLWQLLQRDPPGAAFRTLRATLRGSESPLHALVGAFGQLDAVRAAGTPLAEVARCYGEAATAAGALAGSEGRAFGGLARVLAAVARLRASSPGWRAAFHDVLLGGPEGPGIDAWMRWAGLPTGRLEPCWKRLDEAVGSISDARPAVSLEQCEELAAAISALREVLAPLAWPEAKALDAVLSDIGRWGGERLEEARRSAAACDRCARQLDRGDEQAALALLDSPEELALLSPAMLRRLARFLLDHLQFRAAQRLRAKVSQRVQLPAVWTHLAPLFAGVASGTFLVLDVGTAWNDVVGAASPVGLVATVGLALALSFALLAGNLASRMAGGREGRAEGVFLRVCRRVLPTYLGALGLATAVSALVLVTLEGTSSRQQASGAPLPFWPQVLLWASLSLFLGLFLGLILQGRGVAAEDQD